MNNPMSLMADAAKLSITQLQQAIKNGTVPPYIGVPLLQQKVKESQQAKQAMAAQQPAQPPVAQGVMQQAQGVDALPTNLPQQGMAGGGIISFAEGGDTGMDDFDPTQSLSAKDFFNLPPALRARHTGKVLFTGLESQKQYESQHDAPTATRAPKGYGSANYDPAAMEQDYRTKANEQYQGYVGSRPEYGIGSIMANRNQVNAAAELQANTKTPYDDAVKYYKSIGDNAGFATAQAKRSEWLKNPTNLMENATKANQAQPQAPTSQAQPQAKPTGIAPPADNSPEAFKLGPTTSVSSRQSSSTSRTGGAGGIGGLSYKPEAYDTSFIDELKKGDLNPDTGKPYTRSEISAQRKQEFIDAGGDPDVYKNQKEAAEKAGTKSEGKRKSDEAAPWFAVAKALGEAKPNEGLAGLLGKGAAAYGTEAGAITDKDEARAESMRKELGQVALAQNAYSQAQAVGDREAMQKAEDRIDESTKLLGTVGMKSRDVANEAKKVGVELAAKMRVAEMQSSDTRYAADKAERVTREEAMQIQADAAAKGVKMSFSEATKQAYLNKNPSVYGADLRDTASQRAGITKQISDLIKSPAYMSADKAKKEIMMTALRNQLAALGPEGGAAPSGNVIDFAHLPTAK